MATSTSQLDASPIYPSARFGRVDEGVDYTQAQPFVAAASGFVSHIDWNFYRGTPSVYVTLDNPITINGHTYRQIYYAETSALVKVGQRVVAGQPVIGPGTAEIGFANNNLPAAHGTYVEGQKTAAGTDFAEALANVLYRNPPDQTPDTKVTSVNEQTGAQTTTAGPKTGGAVGGIASLADLLARISDPSYILRGLQIVAGAVLVLIGLYLLARQVGLAVSEQTPQPIRDAATTFTPTGRAVRAASRESRVATAGAGAARERRAEESHQARLKTQAARTTEVRSRSRRAATAARKQREADFNRGYIDRAIEEESPNLSAARKNRE